ncbi:hypothetical protein [Marinilactibacillus psychrotolerans]|uniref:Uncharacterized protein n=1 Tax=Marinilactibacillus psychrotolerans TaxID=191770 RepID=A0AAV3WYS2_9LACT|nr:hypothetical protein [Marinilactibacillus psychrotolerans]GEL67225.1 hypothetical protein MPS01_13800 [Marinilactibacillus psychrotolerans]GEQ36029.1 hypothetical protein M132T_15370 [Marinilactibacillus psychrotolerans]SDC60467.1 hypothetical protein SAMN04488013_10741 [Marinilactibacillus psychrotolerans]
MSEEQKKPKKEKPILIDLKTVRIVHYDDKNVVIEKLTEKGKWAKEGYFTTVIQALRRIQAAELLLDPDQVFDFMSYMQGIERSNAQIREVLRQYDSI